MPEHAINVDSLWVNIPSNLKVRGTDDKPVMVPLLSNTLTLTVTSTIGSPENLKLLFPASIVAPLFTLVISKSHEAGILFPVAQPTLELSPVFVNSALFKLTLTIIGS